MFFSIQTTGFHMGLYFNCKMAITKKSNYSKAINPQRQQTINPQSQQTTSPKTVPLPYFTVSALSQPFVFLNLQIIYTNNIFDKALAFFRPAFSKTFFFCQSIKACCGLASRNYRLHEQPKLCNSLCRKAIYFKVKTISFTCVVPYSYPK